MEPSEDKLWRIGRFNAQVRYEKVAVERAEEYIRMNLEEFFERGVVK